MDQIEILIVVALVITLVCVTAGYCVIRVSDPARGENIIQPQIPRATFCVQGEAINNTTSIFRTIHVVPFRNNNTNPITITAEWINVLPKEPDEEIGKAPVAMPVAYIV